MLPNPDSETPDQSRLTRLEESVAFTDRAAEEAGRQIADLYRRIDLLSRRIESLEKRLENASQVESQGEPRRITDEQLLQDKPPHSA